MIPEVHQLTLSEDMEHSHLLVSLCCQTLLRQFARDENIRNLLDAILDAFEFSKQAEVLKEMEPGSLLAAILDEMLQCVSKCAKFIKSYAKDVPVGTSSSLPVGHSL
jgi:hypothetical protein